MKREVWKKGLGERGRWRQTQRNVSGNQKKKKRKEIVELASNDMVYYNLVPIFGYYLPK